MTPTNEQPHPPRSQSPNTHPRRPGRPHHSARGPAQVRANTVPDRLADQPLARRARDRVDANLARLELRDRDRDHANLADLASRDRRAA